MVGRSHGVRCLLLVWPVLLTVMADLRKIDHAMRSMRSHPAWQDGAEAVLACPAHRTRCDANVSFARVNAEKMLQMRALTRGRSRLASKIPHDTLFAPRGVLGRKTSTYRTKCWSRSNIRKGSAMAHKSSASSDTGEAIAADTPETREEMASKLVDRFALWSGVAGLIPVPVVDVFAVGGLQIQMVRRLSQIYDVEFSENRGKALIASLAGSMIPATSGIGAASVLKAVPVIGTIAAGFVMPALSAGATYAI